jgi:glycosyltransferase involved in cell wall biosynthesis
MDKIEDLVKDIPFVKYYSYEEQLSLGKKRNIMNNNATGDIIIYMDDDDYYPFNRVSHAVDVLLKNPQYLIAGSSEMHCYFPHINQLYQFGPYLNNHATAATFAFRKELLKETQYNEDAALAEEKEFLKNYTIPLIQLDTDKTILVFSHIHNTFDKKKLIETPNHTFKESRFTLQTFIKKKKLVQFYKNIDKELEKYPLGKINFKPEVLKQINELSEKRFKDQTNQFLHHINQLNQQLNEAKKHISMKEEIIQLILKQNKELKEKLDNINNIPKEA